MYLSICFSVFAFGSEPVDIKHLTPKWVKMLNTISEKNQVKKTVEQKSTTKITNNISKDSNIKSERHAATLKRESGRGEERKKPIAKQRSGKIK